MDDFTLIRAVAGTLAMIIFVILLFPIKKKLRGEDGYLNSARRRTGH